jgi:hypothetical protein
LAARFVPVFWSPVHFSDQPGTLGAMIDTGHPLWADFPTDTYADWQWWELLSQSYAVDLSAVPVKLTMPFRFVDEFNRNALPAAIFEAKVGRGRLLVCTLDISSDLDSRLAARQLRRSLFAYMDGKDFNPQAELAEAQLQGLFQTAHNTAHESRPVKPAAKKAKVFCVDVASPKAAATNPGTESQPWKTMPRLSPRPLSIAGVSQPLLSLGGEWKFTSQCPEYPGSVGPAILATWRNIQVPGEWVFQGFKVEKERFACYGREFKVPKDWAGRRIKLRFDSVQSECTVWVNGQKVGGHEGGFVPFEMDVTEALKQGTNTLTVAVRNESVSDVLASATQYAGHSLGGITRKVTLFALPQLNLAAQALSTRFVDTNFTDATLHLHLEIDNESAADRGATLTFQLFGPDGKLWPLEAEGAGACSFAATVKAGLTEASEHDLPVRAPLPWDTEHPRLYTLRTELKSGGQTSEVLTQRFGFRQVEARGQEVFVNGHPIKLHGVCRHETHPLMGRSLTPDLWRKDAEIFRAANVNYIRTSHYPPPEEFLDACDELGLFVECEAPLCWVGLWNDAWKQWDYRDAKFLPALTQANLENVIANRNHPSIILWSLANESRWSLLFAQVLDRVKQLDPTRLTSFHDQCWGGENAGGSQADVANYHYPETNGPALCDKGTRPTLFGEYCHVETYNQREVFTDPGVRDQWGPRFAEMYDLMYRHPGCLGGAIWSGIDDVFDLPDGQVEGYGFWGVIDGWRRAKPETFHVKKAYSPVRVLTRQLPVDQKQVKIALENRYNFANLSETRIEWTLGHDRGTVAADIAPRRAGEMILALKHEPRAGQVLHLRFTDPRGFVCEEVQLPVGAAARPVPHAKPLKPGKLGLKTTAAIFNVTGPGFSCEINRQTGQLESVSVSGRPVLAGGPALMALPLTVDSAAPVDLTQFGPLNTPCQGWSPRSVTAAENGDGSIVIRAEGSYTNFEGKWSLRITSTGELELQYDFTIQNALNPRQAGMVFYVARECDTLSWERLTPWSAYPKDHIGRPVGSAKANPNEARHIIHLDAAPRNPWSLDTTALGTADFRSTKEHIFAASLRGPGGREVAVVSDGAQSARAFVDGARIGWLIARLNTGGGDGFFSAHHRADRRPLKAGGHIADTIRLQLVKH